MLLFFRRVGGGGHRRSRHPQPRPALPRRGAMRLPPRLVDRCRSYHLLASATARALYRVLIYALLSVPVLPRQTPAAVWTSIGPDGARVTAMSFNPLDATHLLAGTGIGGVFGSGDAGITWSPTGLTSGHVRGLAVDPQNPARVYAATDRGIFASADSGVSWSALALDTHGGDASVAVDSGNSNILYVGLNAGTASGVLIS